MPKSFFLASGHGTAIIVAEHNGWAIIQGRIKHTLTRDVAIIHVD